MRAPALLVLIALLASLVASPSASAAQAPPAVVVGRVVDSAGRALERVDVRLAPDDVPGEASVVAARTTADGRFALVAPASPVAYRLVARRLGLRPDTTSVLLRAGDTTRVTIVLGPAAVALPTITVRERRAARFSRPFIDSTEIADAGIPRSRPSAMDVVRYLRPVMLGDWNWKCDRTEHVFVNGRRVTSPSITSMADVLAAIPADDIAEMRYVNCWDTSMPGVAGSNTVYVVLKPGRRYRW